MTISHIHFFIRFIFTCIFLFIFFEGTGSTKRVCVQTPETPSGSALVYDYTKYTLTGYNGILFRVFPFNTTHSSISKILAGTPIRIRQQIRQTSNSRTILIINAFIVVTYLGEISISLQWFLVKIRGFILTYYITFYWYTCIYSRFNW